jgi:putative flavoprotein involved in K+ transport
MADVGALIVGAGQAGLGMAAALQALSVSAQIVDEREAIGGAWDDYYKSLRLFSPVQYSGLPGLAFPGPPDHYPTADEVSRYLRDFARKFQLSAYLGQRVEHVSIAPDGVDARLSSGARIRARAIIAATGTFRAPRLPTIPGADRFGGTTLHSSAYMQPNPFTGQRVIVVGAANSAVQIAYDLLPHAASVTLAARQPIRFVPQRIIGRDIHFWFGALGIDRMRWLSDQGTPVIDDGRYRDAIRTRAIAQRPMFEAFTDRGVQWPDGSRSDTCAVIFATGFRPDLGFLGGLPIFDRNGQIDQRGGVAARAKNVFFIGQPGLRGFASGTLRGIARDAPIVARAVARQILYRERR